MKIQKSKSVLVVGATGMLGRHIVEALLQKPDLQITLLVRNRHLNGEMNRTLEEWLYRGVSLVQGDVLDQESLLRACQGKDVVLSVVSGSREIAAEGQLNLLEAARKAGVGRFIPSDYALNYFGLQPGDNAFLDYRIEVAEAVKASGLAYTFILTGCFTEVLFMPLFNVFDLPNRRATFWGDGETKFDITTMPDTARYTAEAVANPLSGQEVVSVAGDVVSMLEVVATYEKLTGKRMSVHREGSVEELKHWIESTKAANPGNPMAYVMAQYQWAMVSGKGKLENLSNHRYPQIKPQRLEAYMEQLKIQQHFTHGSRSSAAS